MSEKLDQSIDYKYSTEEVETMVSQNLTAINLEDKLSLEIKEQEAVVQKLVSQKIISLEDGGNFECLERISKSRNNAARMVTIAGLCSNVTVKGIMKAVGFIFKAIMGHIFGLSPILAVLFPATMHLFFNCFSIFIPVFIIKLGYMNTYLLGVFFIFSSLFNMSQIPSDGNVEVIAFQIIFSGALLGIGAACHFHTGVQMLNLLVEAKKNAFSNGISLAGNTLGAIIVFIIMGNLFKSLHYGDSLFYLSFGSGAILLLTTGLYYFPQRYISKYADDDVQQTSKQTGNSIWNELWDKNLLSEPVYYLLIVSQCCNAIGFLNLTNFLNVHIFQTLQLTDEYIAYTLIPMQIFDFLGRIFVPLVSDKLQPYCKFIRHWIYILGCIGTGSCMMSLELAKTWNQLLVLCVLMGFFSSCFIALWNSVVKAETQNHKGFTIMYSHSLFLTGIVQMIATLGMMTLTQGNKEANYGELLFMFGIILIMAALPVFLIILYRISCERKPTGTKMSRSNRKIVAEKITPNVEDPEGRQQKEMIDFEHPGDGDIVIDNFDVLRNIKLVR